MEGKFKKKSSFIFHLKLSDCLYIDVRYAYLRCNDLDLAEKALTHALSLDPSSEVALYYLSLLLQK